MGLSRVRRVLALVAQAVGGLILVHFAAIAIAAQESSVPTDVDWLFDRNRLLDVHIAMATDDWAELRSQTRAMALALRKPAAPKPYTYFPGELSIDGYKMGKVKVRKKGFIGSLDQQYPSLKVKGESSFPNLAVDRLTLNNNKQDRTIVSQFLAYQFFADAGVPVSRCNLARVTVNEEYLGIYSNVESIRKPFLRRQFGDDSGKLYEGTLADFIVDRIDDFEAKSVGDDDDRKELRGLASLLAAEGDIDPQSVAHFVDLDEFLRYWSIESLINAWDGYTGNQNNYFVYFHPLDSKFHFIPWGADATFLRMEFVKSKSESVHDASVLANRLYHNASIANQYREVLQEVLDTLWDEDRLLAEVDRLEELIRPHVHDRQRDFHGALGDTRKFIRTRRNEMEYDLERWPRTIADKPREPAFTRSVGGAKGTFEAIWTESEPKDKYAAGKAALEMTLDGDQVEFTRLGVHLQQDEKNGGTRTIVFVGKRKSNGIRVTLRLAMSEARFQSARRGQAVVVQGNLEEGGFGLFGFLSPQGVRLTGGTVAFSEFGAKEGQSLAGKIDVDVLRLSEF